MQTRFLKRGKRGVVLPALILISMVLLLLVSLLVSTGTQSLRISTLSQQSDVATYAAESGLVRAVEEYRREGKLPARFAGELKASGASFVVTAYHNDGTDPMQVTDGPSIPPSTMYLLSEGLSPNGTREKAGALFRTGLGAFQAGVVSDSLSADKSTFDAYDSVSNPDPASSQQPDRGIMASNRIDPAIVAPQFTLADTSVKGGVFTAPGSTPAQQIRKSGTTVVSREGTLASPVTLEDIEVPKITKSGKANGGSTTDGSFDETTYSPPSWRLTQGVPTELSVSWNTTTHTFEFWDVGTNPDTRIAAANVGELQAAESGSGVLDLRDGSNRHVHIDFGAGTITYNDVAANPGSAVTGTTPIPSILSDAMHPTGVETRNPSKITDGTFESVTIDSSTPTEVAEGTYVIKDLIITDGGQLGLPVGQKATIYVTRTLRAEGENALLNNSRLPTNLKIYYTGNRDVELSGGSSSYLTLIAPKAEVSLVGPEGADPTRFFGALVGKTVNVVNAAFHYDVATDGVGTGTDGSALSLLSRHRL